MERSIRGRGKDKKSGGEEKVCLIGFGRMDVSRMLQL